VQVLLSGRGVMPSLWSVSSQKNVRMSPEYIVAQQETTAPTLRPLYTTPIRPLYICTCTYTYIYTYINTFMYINIYGHGGTHECDLFTFRIPLGQARPSHTHSHTRIDARGLRPQLDRSGLDSGPGGPGGDPGGAPDPVPM